MGSKDEDITPEIQEEDASDETGRDRSVRQNSPAQRVCCALCDNTYSSVGSLEKHLLSVHRDSLHFPDLTDIPVEIDPDVVQLDATPRVACTLCQKQFLNVDNLESHLLTVHQDALLFPDLAKDASSPVECDTEAPKRRNSPIPRVACSRCKKSFSKIERLDMHLAMHQDDPLLSGLQYGKEHGEGDAEAERNRNSPAPRVYCTSCNKSFSSVHRLEKHLTVHQDGLVPKSKN